MDELYNNIIELVSQKKFNICENLILKNINDINLLINFVDNYYNFLNKSTLLILTKIICKLIYISPNIFFNYYKSYTLFKKLLIYDNLQNIIKFFINNFEKNNKLIFFIKKNIQNLKKNHNCFNKINNLQLYNNIFNFVCNFEKIIDIDIIPFIYSLYDNNTYHNTNFILRIKSAKNDITKNININEIKKRLIIIYNYFGKDFLILHNIKIITNNDYYNLSYYEQILYFTDIITSLSNIFRTLQSYIINFKEIHDKIINSLNYNIDDLYIIKFNSDSTSDNDVFLYDDNFYNSDESSSSSEAFDDTEIQSVLDNVINTVIDNHIDYQCKLTLNNIIDNML
jgi:hypothetical protein